MSVLLKAHSSFATFYVLHLLFIILLFVSIMSTMYHNIWVSHNLYKSKCVFKRVSPTKNTQVERPVGSISCFLEQTLYKPLLAVESTYELNCLFIVLNKY